MKNWLKYIHNRPLQWANSKWGTVALFVFAFADASFLPLPTPMLFLGMALLNIGNAYKYALFGTLGILAGALAGYGIGHFAWLTTSGEYSAFAHFMFDHLPGLSEASYNAVQVQFDRWNFWILIVASFLPLPFNIFAISSGVFDVNILVFSLATFLSQGTRFFLMALLIKKVGPEMKRLLEKKMNPTWVIASFCIGIAIIFVPGLTSLIRNLF